MPFTWESASFGQFLLELAYIGTEFRGLATQGVDHNNAKRLKLDGCDKKTIEDVIFETLKLSNLVVDFTTSNFSRCGRTDAGVHARRNYICLSLRLNPRQSPPYDYVAILNRMLPNAVRVTRAWSVPIWFDARFHCTKRSYKYFFSTEGLDLSLMEEAAAMFVGSHDFRHFCKVDKTKECSFRRQISRCEVRGGDGRDGDGNSGDAINGGVGRDSSSGDRDADIGTLYVESPAFLWHQIRCMMGILLAVGKKYHPPSIVANSLIPSPEKPRYELATPEGLVLWDCDYGQLYIDKDQSIAQPNPFAQLQKEVKMKALILDVVSS